MADNHYSVNENGILEVCVLAVNYGSDDITFTVWIYIKGIHISMKYLKLEKSRLFSFPELEIWCDLTFMLLGNTGFSMYKNITIPDDDIVNPWRSVYLKLKSADYRVTVQENYTQALVWIEDNERKH